VARSLLHVCSMKTSQRMLASSIVALFSAACSNASNDNAALAEEELANRPSVAPDPSAFPLDPFDPDSCSGQELTSATASALFDRGTAQLDLGTARVVYRERHCSPLTGCSEWRKVDSGLTVRQRGLHSGRAFSDVGVSLEANVQGRIDYALLVRGAGAQVILEIPLDTHRNAGVLGKSTIARFESAWLALADTEFSGPVKSDKFTLTATASCTRLVLHGKSRSSSATTRELEAAILTRR